ncbi:MAG: hypothetical protein LBI42_14265 [Chitinispirillales bacterium]|nr:hypothetical protein [Chitinispirillales bacterium]
MEKLINKSWLMTALLFTINNVYASEKAAAAVTNIKADTLCIYKMSNYSGHTGTTSLSGCRSINLFSKLYRI